jgi:hypothetical protein
MLINKYKNSLYLIAFGRKIPIYLKTITRSIFTTHLLLWIMLPSKRAESASLHRQCKCVNTPFLSPFLPPPLPVLLRKWRFFFSRIPQLLRKRAALTTTLFSFLFPIRLFLLLTPSPSFFRFFPTHFCLDFQWLLIRLLFLPHSLSFSFE